MWLSVAWLFLGVPLVTSTSLTGWYVPQDLPTLADVMLNTCGAGFVYDPSSPCHYHVFGLGIAWSECSYIHRKGEESLKAWKGCVKSCAFDGSLCENACAPGVPRHKTTAEECNKECSKAIKCLKGATDGAKSQADASDAAGACFKANRHPAGELVKPHELVIETDNAGVTDNEDASVTAALLEQHRAFVAAAQKGSEPVVRNLGMFSAGCELLKYNGRWRKPLNLRKSPDTAAPEAPALPEVKPFKSQEMAWLSQDFTRVTTTMQPPGAGLATDTLLSPEDGVPTVVKQSGLPPVLDTPPKEMPVRPVVGSSMPSSVIDYLTQH